LKKKKDHEKTPNPGPICTRHFANATARGHKELQFVAGKIKDRKSSKKKTPP